MLPARAAASAEAQSVVDSDLEDGFDCGCFDCGCFDSLLLQVSCTGQAFPIQVQALCFAELCCLGMGCDGGGTQLGVVQANEFGVQAGNCLHVHKIVMVGSVGLSVSPHCCMCQL